MSELITRTLVGNVRAIRAEGEPEDTETNVYEFTASTENAVRVFDWERGEVIREVLRMDGVNLKDFERNPVVLDCHRSRGSEHVAGKVLESRIENRELVQRVEFDDHPMSTGERNLRLVRKGMLRGVSIGYLPRESQDMGVDERSGEPIVHRTKWDLLELSTASIPADPDALKRDYESRLEGRSVTEKKPPAPEPKPEEPAERTLEEQETAAREVAGRLTSNEAQRESLVAFALGAADPDAATAGLERQHQLLAARVLDRELRELGGKLLAEAEDPLTLDVLPLLRAERARQVKASGTPEPPNPTPASKPKEGERTTTNEGEPNLPAFLGGF